jgi:predicted helicase
MSKVFHSSLHGLSSVKERELSTLDLTTTQWSHLDIESSNFYLFIPQNSSLRQEYDRYWKITDIFPVNTMGFQTHRDHFAIDFDKDELLNRMQEMFNRDISDHDYAQKYSLKDSSDWNLRESRRALRFDCEWQGKFINCSYRPFDLRYCYFSKIVMDRPRQELIDNVAEKDNLCLLSSRKQSKLGYQHCWVANLVANDCVVSTNSGEANQVFPLYLYPTTPGEIEMGITRKPNIAPEFLAKLKQNLGYTPTPESIFNYLYAILHSPTYRSRYAEFLKGDFPRVPLTRDVDRFRQLSELGEQLVNLHLMKSPILDQLSSSFSNNGGGCIVDAGHPKYENACTERSRSGKVVINRQKDGFMDVPEAVWNFHVGGYQVCHKWLKDRKGRTLSQDDIGHYQKIVIALGQSIDLMAKIDAAIPNWPMDSESN